MSIVECKNNPRYKDAIANLKKFARIMTNKEKMCGYCPSQKPTVATIATTKEETKPPTTPVQCNSKPSGPAEPSTSAMIKYPKYKECAIKCLTNNKSTKIMTKPQLPKDYQRLFDPDVRKEFISCHLKVNITISCICCDR